MKGITERIHRTFRKHDIALYAMAGFTIMNAMVNPRDLLDVCEQCRVIYECACDVCGELYVGETGRSLVERVDESSKSIERQDSKSTLQHQEMSRHRLNNNPIIDRI